MKLNDTRKMVQFIENCSPYLAGERAAFPPKEAQRLKDIKKAVFLDENGNPIYDVAKVKSNDEPNAENGQAGDDAGDAGKASKSRKGKGKGKTKAGGKRKRVKADE